MPNLLNNKRTFYQFRKQLKLTFSIGVVAFALVTTSCQKNEPVREKILLNDDWQFFKYESAESADKLIYDVRPEVIGETESKVADAKPTNAVVVEAKQEVLKPWILPTANSFINKAEDKHVRPEGNPGSDFPFVQSDFDDTAWENINLPHDWAIKGPFQEGWNSEVGGGMGRLPSNGIAWYRKKIDVTSSDRGKRIFLEFEGTMSYAMVWLNGNLVGGWPYGYNSWQVDLTPYVKFGSENQIAVRLDNPNHSARWYPGGGINRNVWLIKTDAVHVAAWGTAITTDEVSSESAVVNIEIAVENNSETDAIVESKTKIFAIDDEGEIIDEAVASINTEAVSIAAGSNVKMKGSVKVDNPKLWGPAPSQQPNLYKAVTTLMKEGRVVDSYETRFGIRSITYDPDNGIIVNGERIQINGVNNHHDLGGIGSAFNMRAAERQLEILREMGCNAIRMSHNPPAPGLLELTDRMGFLVLNEIFDSWETKKTPHDFHLIFPEWSEADTRAFIRRDRNCPSVIIWSFGNEVGEQYNGTDGAAVAQRLYDFVKEEDPTRPTILAMNFAKAFMELPVVPDMIGLNYQGEGIRQSPEFEGTERIRTAPSYDIFHETFPDKVVLSTETASAFSSRGIYLFPVTPEISSPTRDGRGGDSKICQVSSYELHAVDFGSSADKVFAAVESHPFVAGEFVWTGWDYLGEPTPYYEARSSYTGIIDLAGFKKDRFYLYQAHWRPDFPMAHILPHWNWPERVGEITPVHVFTSGDEAELFLNGKSLGKKQKGQYEYRLRWDDVIYEPGELKVVAYKEGKEWATDVMQTTGAPALLNATADRTEIAADGSDLSFITVDIQDENELFMCNSTNEIEFSIEGPGEIVATDNGDPYCMVEFPSLKRPAFSGKVLAIVRSQKDKAGTITVTAKAEGLTNSKIEIISKQ